MDDKGVAAWKFPPIVAAIAVSIVGGFYLGGPGLGMAVGALAAATIVVVAVRNPPRPLILPAAAQDSRRHVLVVLDSPLEGEAVDEVSELVHGDDQTEPEVRLLAPCRHRFLDRWASDLGPGLDRAQRNLVISAAALAAAGIGASAVVGDEDLVQMVEDELRVFPATDVVLVTADEPGRNREESDAKADLTSRLCVSFSPIYVEAPDSNRDSIESKGR